MDADWLEAILKRNERENGVYKIVGVEAKSAVPKGQNYVGIVTRATCDVILGSGRKTKKSLIIKGEQGGKKKDVLQDFSTFRTEIKMYKNVLTKMEILLDEYHDKNDLLWCQMIGSEEYTMLMFEDLTEIGYSVAPRQNCLDFDHGALVLKSMGRFHAMSKILIDRKLITDEDYGVFAFLVDTPMIENFVKGGFKQLAAAMRSSWPPEWEKVTEKIEKQANIATKKLVSLAKTEFEDEFKVLNHGDTWTCNMMFKYSDDKKTPIGIKFIDFQLSHYKSFAWDVVYFLYTSIIPVVRRSRYEELIKAYWESLDSTLRFYGYDEKIPSYDDVIKAIDHLDYFSFYLVALLLPLMTAEGTDAFDMEKILEEDSSTTAFDPGMFTSGMFFKHAGEDFKIFINKGVI